MESPSEIPSSPDPDPKTPSPETTASSSQLRFPAPAADERVSNWVESLAVSRMSARSEDGSILGESNYEFIDTDTDSRDGNATESIASTDFGRPEDDVASLADTERSGEDSGDEDNSEGAPIPTFPGLDEAAEAFGTPTIGRNSAVLLEEHDIPLTQSIEFEEPFSLAADDVSVKHTVADLPEEHTARVVEVMKLSSPPQRLVVTIRQTMTKQGLSTRDPLRILYVGSHSAKQDIIHKLASSVTASVEGAKKLRQSSSQLYNVVPVSAFGSERTPEIELMHSSGYQIKVEDCTYASTLKFEDDPQKPDVLKLTLDDNVSHHSVPDEPGFIVEPHWELPHIAVFYCSDSDDADVKQTRSITRKFMGRHSVPSITISHRQLFDRIQPMSLDQHSIHMCLESRASNGRGTIIHQRLPIDLASFLNIDARQMNRNLAYLTGLHEPLPETVAMVASPKRVEVQSSNTPDVEKTPYSISDSVSFIRNWNGAEWRALLPVGLLLIGVFTAVLTGIPSYRFSSKPAISINSKIMSTIPISSTLPVAQSSLDQSITSPTARALMSTRTITVTHAQSSGPNSLSVVPSMELGRTAHEVHSQPKTSKKSPCSAEILGDREILIRIPSATKLSWLTKEAMSVNITRGNETVDTERAYSSDEGIVLLLPKKEAYGLLNISVITTRKPRVNETFQVDFGTFASQTWQALMDKMWSVFPEEMHLVDPAIFGNLRSSFDEMTEEARSQSQSAWSIMEEARRLAMEQASSAGEGITNIAKHWSLEAAKRSAILSKEIGIQISDAEATMLKQLNHMQDPFKNGIFKAQVQAKLMWLKMQGKEEEYKEYAKAAFEATHSEDAETKTAKLCKGTRAEQKKKRSDNWAKKDAERLARKAARWEALAAKKASKGGKKPI
ncbi:hypothetical protein LOCC1_G002643 [Lachnellula occidentalis]|uniref:Uncharacterized protein n=1 Tax=Lachnellula occidentalis TaxID=215460 RepID=A0A8H8UGU1_9HELO|nr:hypothetical protein LOCC1_G002643 [Lachnellula occidentalis]